ncbi:MAG: hypothetical protein ACTHJ0_02450, partial [Flavipsychrobacter sp.]
LSNSTPYYIDQDAVSNSGFIVTSTYKRTRWYDGSTYVWLGRKKQTGRGEANSGLEFDMLADKQPNT